MPAADLIHLEEIVEWQQGIAADLLRAEVPREDIVLAFRPPEMRPLTELAVA
jgi:hypothetical protein